MTSHDRFRMQGLDYLERLKPLVQGLLVALCEVEVCVVVNTVARYDQTNGRHMQPRRMRSVRMT